MPIDTRGRVIPEPDNRRAVMERHWVNGDVTLEEALIEPLIEWIEELDVRMYVGNFLTWPDGNTEELMFPRVPLEEVAQRMGRVLEQRVDARLAIPPEIRLRDLPDLDGLPEHIHEAYVKKKSDKYKGADSKAAAAEEDETKTRFIRLFIYGAQQRGLHEQELLAPYEDLGYCHITGPYSLYSYKNFPILWHNGGYRNYTTYGRVYRVPLKEIKSLDERFLIGGFLREKIKISYDSGWTYVWHGDLPGASEGVKGGLVHIEAGDYAKWRSKEIENQLEGSE